MKRREEKYLPNWSEAQIHGKASKIGFYDQNSENYCHCCQQKIQKQEIPLCQNTKSLQFLGFGFPLFYMFIRNCIILLILLIISSNFISLYISISDGDNYCASHQQTGAHHSGQHALFALSPRMSHEQWSVKDKQDPFLQCSRWPIKFARTDPSQKDYEFVFRICSFVIHVLALLYIKDKIIKTYDYYDEMESDLSDYAILIGNIPKDIVGIMGRFNGLFSDIRNDNNERYSIHEIILIPQSQKIYHLNHQEEHALQYYLHAKKEGHSNLQKQYEQVSSIDHQKKKLVYKTIQDINHDNINARNAIIIFQTEPQKQQFLEKVEEYQAEGKMAKYFNNADDPLIIDQAPQPRQIIYENLQYDHERVKNLIIGWGLSLLFLIIITVVFYFIQMVKTNNLVDAIEEEHQHPGQISSRKTIATIISWITLFGIVFFNKFVMGTVLHYFTHLQKHSNKALEDFSFAFKYALGMFFTTALMTIAVEALKYGNYYEHDFGVIQQETIMFILCAFLIPIIWIIHPWQLCHIFSRQKHYKGVQVTQHQANHLMADYHYDMGKRYAQLIQMMWFTFLYADLIPIGAFFILVGFCIYYWIDKYNLLRRSSLQGNISGDLAKKILTLLDLTLFWRFFGQLIIDAQIRDGPTTLTIILLILSIVYMLVPWQAFLELVNSEKFKLNSKTFSDEKKRFANDTYKLYHPFYKELVHKDTQNAQLDLQLFDLLTYGKDLAKSQNNTNQPNQRHSISPFNIIQNGNQPIPSNSNIQSNPSPLNFLQSFIKPENTQNISQPLSVNIPNQKTNARPSQPQAYFPYQPQNTQSYQPPQSYNPSYEPYNPSANFDSSKLRVLFNAPK